MWYYLIALFVIALDQLTKWIVVQKMEYGESITVIENFFYITSHRNRGAAWGILEGKMWFFYLITIIVIGAIIVYIQKLGKKEARLKVALAFMLGGAIGNFIDRLIRKEVVDFIDTYIFSYNYPIFNIADSALVIGVILVCVFTLFDGKKESK
ncbi:signal peptidase II [Priestia endophytica]|uniref:Lipoprotein signal peptidase n=2 Tax=Priestia endophytica TaxID=135735 RepID=A0AAX1QBV6_9BACI|nr:signal peptidase II [Priestia endophytica]KAB2494762.1 lipoprotein signal peptidase [Priestia endophytica]KYG35832.1 signal peptidase II [Priestia endophytica]MBG9814778.1 peptidase A8 [Priestia endophytica]MCM3539350.1 signal peptidase II [Priestia endophytica]RAS79437.1 signal peptidase II [Priestia endophytica]